MKKTKKLNKDTLINGKNKLKNVLFKATTSEDSKKSSRKLINSLWAIVFGLIVSSIFIAAIGKNPLEAFSSLIKGGQNLKKTTWVYFGMYSFGAMAIAFAFKSGLFNIGVPGQMMAGGVASYFVLQKMGSTSTGNMFVALLVSVLTGFFVASVIGLIKSLLNVHEVVSSIMLNWIIFYLCKHVFRAGEKYNQGGYEESAHINITSELFQLKGNAWIFSIVLVVIVAIGLWFLFSKTTIGFKIKSVGLNKDASKYSGYKNKSIMMSSLGMSGALAGVSGFMFYIVNTSGVIDFSTGQPLGFGFDAIAISLLAYNSLIGVPLAAILFSFLQTGKSTLELDTGIGGEFYAIIVGLIIYFSAVSIIFSKFKPANYFSEKAMFILNEKYRKRRIRDFASYKLERVRHLEEIRSKKEIYKSNILTLNKNKRIYKAKNKVIQNKLLEKKISYNKSSKLHAELKSNQLKVIEFEDKYGKTEYILSKLDFKNFKRLYRKTTKLNRTKEYAQFKNKSFKNVKNVLANSKNKMLVRKGGK